MSQAKQEEPLHLSQVVPMRLYAVDEEAIGNLAERTGLTKIELRRRAVHAGVTIITDSLKPIAELNNAARSKKPTS